MELDFTGIKEIVLLNVQDGFPTEAAWIGEDGLVEIKPIADYDELEAMHAWSRSLAGYPRHTAVRFATRFLGEENILRQKARAY